jgi:hypothetical protein
VVVVEVVVVVIGMMVVVMVVAVRAVVMGMGMVVVEYMVDTSKRYVVFASVLHPEVELLQGGFLRGHAAL